MDDEIARGTTRIRAADRLREQERAFGARWPARTGCSPTARWTSWPPPSVTEVVCTNSAPVPARAPEAAVLSVAPALAEAISRIHDGESVSSLFDQP